MTPLATLLGQGAGHAWLFVPSAMLLGALHGLEPGHSKTMMAAFIIAVRGTVKQAVLLGVAATLSHTAVVWALALAGLYFGANWGTDQTEPYFQLGSAALVVGIAVWMAARVWRDQGGADHHHAAERTADLGHWTARIEVVEDGVPPRFHLHFAHGGQPVEPPQGMVATIETERDDLRRQSFAFVRYGDHLASVDEIPEPHEFVARLTVAHDGHSHHHATRFTEHGHDHEHGHGHGHEHQDAHQRAHARDIRDRFASRAVTTGQIVMFGLTGGLIPCPASITVLLLCLQLKQLTLGVTLVLCFSIGLGVTMVAAGTVAALSLRHVSTRWPGFGAFARRAPYVSSGLMVIVGLYTGYHGWLGLG